MAIAGPRRARAPFFLTAVGAGVATIALSWVLMPSWWPAWLDHVGAVQIEDESVTIATLLTHTVGEAGAWLAALILLGAVALALQFDPRGDAWLRVWFALSSAATIYSNTYDLLLLVVALVLGAGALPRDAGGRRALVLIAGAVLLILVLPVLHSGYVRRSAELVPLTKEAAQAPAFRPG